MPPQSWTGRKESEIFSEIPQDEGTPLSLASSMLFTRGLSFGTIRHLLKTQQSVWYIFFNADAAHSFFFCLHPDSQRRHSHFSGTNQDNLTQKSTTIPAFTPEGLSYLPSRLNSSFFCNLKDICIPQRHFLLLCGFQITLKTLTKDFEIPSSYIVELKKRKNKFLN